MKKLTKKQIKKLPNNPSFDTLPDELKNKERFEEIEKELIRIMHSDHTHIKAKNPLQSFLNCKRCFSKMIKKRDRIKELGFESYEQYLKWRKIMQVIINEQNLIFNANN